MTQFFIGLCNINKLQKNYPSNCGSWVKFLEENNKRLKLLSTEAWQQLIDACRPHLRPIVVTALNTGMRKGEILHLKWEENIDLKHGFILPEVTKNGERREIPIKVTGRDPQVNRTRVL